MCEQLLEGWIEDVRAPVHAMVRAGSPEQRFRWAFQRGALDSLRAAYRVCCPVCRPKITTIADHYREVA